MATAPAAPLVSVDEYLNTSYERDVEYVDGVLVEKGMPTIAHNFFGRLLLFWFAQFEHKLRFTTMYDVRTEIIKRARYRLPDLMLCPLPLPNGGVVDVVPWVVIEIVSPDDTIRKTRARFLDYANRGVPHVLQMDPEEYVAHRFDKGSMIETKFESLELPTGAVPFDSEELFQKLIAELANLRS
ncbi:MAG TPA: Uma2 family endonuclease [Bryobacteraceae bacterium]|nr:Uma2 family endonuclease [Bryobacteraceae bacterium]